MATTIIPERPDSPRASALIAELEAYLAPQYPDESRHGFSVDQLLRDEVAFYLMRHDGVAAGCGGVQLFGTAYGEIKRMYVRPRFRGLGLGKLMLDRLAEHARQHGVSVLRLETGIYQAAAIRLYERWGFERIPPFGEYKEDPLSLFFEKHIAPQIDVRLFEPEDAEALSRLIVQNLQQVLIQDYSPAAIRALIPSFTPEKLIQDAERQLTLVGLLGSDIVGTASLYEDRVRTVFVDVTRHQSGIGRQLMVALEAHARQRHLKQIYLMAGLSACGFYEWLGYATVERIEHEMNGVPVPVIHMEKMLPSDTPGTV